MILFPTSIDALIEAEGTIRAGGTDLQERRHRGLHAGPLVDLRDLPGLAGVEPAPEGGLTIGAKTTIAAVAADPRVQASYPGLAQAAGGLATPQIRARATVGGNLLQEVRCWYYRSPEFQCLKKGGSTCLAREGDHLYHACFDQGPCVAPHPSTLAVALMAYGATAATLAAEPRTIDALIGDGKDARRTHHLAEGDAVTAIALPPALPGESAAYFRAISRARAEWPLVEVVARLQAAAGKITSANVVIGGVAPTPLRLPAVEAALVGQGADAFPAAAALSVQGAAPLPQTAYKLHLIPAAVEETLARAWAALPATSLGVPG